MAKIDKTIDDLSERIKIIEQKIDLIMKRFDIPQPKKPEGVGFIPSVIK